MELAVPANLYGMAIAEPPQLSIKHDGRIVCFLEVFRVYFMLLVNYFVCSLFILQVNEMNVSAEHHCSMELVLLEFICIFIFEAQMLNELQDSCSTVFLVLFAGGSDDQPVQRRSSSNNYGMAREASPTSGAVLVGEATEGRGWMRRFTKRFRKAPTEESSGIDWKFEGISWAFKAWSLLFVALPKLLLGLAVAYIGAVYISKSEDGFTMVMNTLAVVFIADIDEILYVAFTSSAMRAELEDMKAVELPLTNAKRLALWLASGILAPMVLTLAAAAVMESTRRADCSAGFTEDEVKGALLHRARNMYADALFGDGGA